MPGAPEGSAPALFNAMSPTTGERTKESQGGVSITPKRLCLDHFEASAKKRYAKQKKKNSLYTHKQMRRARKEHEDGNHNSVASLTASSAPRYRKTCVTLKLYTKPLRT